MINLLATVLSSVFGFFLAFVILGFQMLQARFGNHVSEFLARSNNIKRILTLLTFALIGVVFEYFTESVWNLSVLYFMLWLTLAILLMIGEAAFAMYYDLLSEKYLALLAENITYFGVDAEMQPEPAFLKLMGVCKTQIKDGNKETAKLLIVKTTNVFWQHIKHIFKGSTRVTHYHNTIPPFNFFIQFFLKPLIDQCRHYNDAETALELVKQSYILLNRSIVLNEVNLVVDNLSGYVSEVGQYALLSGFEGNADMQMNFVHELFRTVYGSKEILELDLPNAVIEPEFDRITVYSLHGVMSSIVNGLVSERNRKGNYIGAIRLIEKYEFSALPIRDENIRREMDWKIRYVVCNEAAEMRKLTLRNMKTHEASEQVRFAGQLYVDVNIDNPYLLRHLTVIIRYINFIAENGILTGAFHDSMQSLYVAGMNALTQLEKDERYLPVFNKVVDAMVQIRFQSTAVRVHIVILDSLFFYVHMIEKGNYADAEALKLDIKLAINKCSAETYKLYQQYKANPNLLYEKGL